jgi:hypothetical protein
MKRIYISTGTNSAMRITRASTEKGYIEAAANLCGDEIGTGLHRLAIRVCEAGQLVWEGIRDVYA